MPGAAASSSRASAALSFLRLHVDGLAVRAEHRHAHAGGGDLEVGVGEDLDGLVDHLLLFLGGAGGQEAVDVRQHVEGDLVRVELLLDRLAGGPLARLRVERRDAALAAARHGLVGAHDDALDADRVVDGLERHDHLDGGAVGRGDDARVRRQVVGVDLGHDERHAGVHAEHARLVDDGGAGGDGLRHVLRAHGAAGGEEDEVDAVERAGAELLHLDLGPLERQPAAGRARAGQQAQLADGEAALLEDARTVPPTTPVAPAMATVYSPAAIRTAPSALSWRTRGVVELEHVVQGAHRFVGALLRDDAEILMGEVLIMSRLMPRSASVLNIMAATPGLVRMPAPMTLTLAMASLSNPPAPSSATTSCSARSAAALSSAGMVHEMSVCPSRWSSG